MGVSGRTLGGIAALALAVTASRPAQAGPITGAQWLVETTGDACAGERAAFAREIALACGAVGDTCRVSETPKDAELRAVIDCSSSGASWTLTTSTMDGRPLASLELSGPQDDRLREAAVEVARDAAPERTLAVDTLRYSLPDEHPAGVTPRSHDVLGLVVGGRASVQEGQIGALGGARLLAGLEFAKAVRGTLGLGADAGGSGVSATRAFHGGLGLTLGAPFEPTAPFGLGVEGGMMAIERYGPAPSYGASLTSRATSVGYGRGSFFVQWPGLMVRPYGSLSAGLLSEATHTMFSAEGGLAFSVF